MPVNNLHNNERELLIRISAGDQESFTRIVDLYWQKVYGFANAYTKSSQLAEESTQDVFMDIWKSRNKLPLLDNFSNYLFVVTRNRVFKLLRSRLITTVEISEEHSLENMWIPHQQMEARELHALIQESIEQLPPIRKRVFVLSRQEGMSYKQIAAELKVSPNTVKEHVSKALLSIRQYLNDQHPPDSAMLLFCLLTLTS